MIQFYADYEFKMGSSISIVGSLRAGRTWVGFLVEARHFFFTETSRPALGPAWIPTEWLPGLCAGEKRLGT